MALKRRTLLGAGIAASAAGFAAPRRPRAQTAGAEPVLRIGVITDLSGQYRDSSGPNSVECVRMAAAEFMAASPGMRVEVLAGDHQNKPDIALGVVRQWFDRDGVDMVVNGNNSAVALAVGNLAREKNRLHVNTAAVSADLTGASCGPNLIHWTYDTWEEAHSTGSALVAAGGKRWFFVTADYVFGRTLQRDTAAAVQAAGGEVLGAAAYPFPGTTDFSAYIVQAQSSGADVLAFANAGGDFVNCVKQAHEFGLVEHGIRLAGMVVFTTDIDALGLDVAKGLVLTSTFYWDFNDRTRAFAARFRARLPQGCPNEINAGDYAGTLHYLKAAKAIGAAAAKASGLDVAAAMKRMPTDDDCFGPGSVRADGRAIHPAYLFEVKRPEDSRARWDYLRQIGTTPAEAAFRPMKDGGCPLVRS
jgi:branched-chain amino acid transport system substrate-binding protein